MQRRHLILLGAACLGTVACSWDESPPSNSPALGGTVGVPPIDDANAPAPPPLAPGEDDTVLDTVPLPADALGTCDVVVTGDVRATWRTLATVESVTYGPWLGQEAIEAAAVDSLVVDASFLQLSCRSAGAQSVSITADDAAIPQRPATYTLAYDAADSVPEERNRFVVVVELDGVGLCRLAGDGVVAITAFDDDGIAGTFDFTARCATGEVVQATGRFDFRNPEPLLTPPPDTAPTPGTSVAPTTTTG